MQGELPEGWEIKKLSDGLIDEIYRYPSFYNIDYILDGVGVLKVENISKTGFVTQSLDSIQYISKTINEKFPKTILKENDLIMAVRGATIGKIALVEKKFVGFNINPNLIKITVNCKKIDPKFFWFFLNSINGRLQFKSKTSSTSKETITVPQFLSIEIPLPPLHVQHEIVTVLEQAEAVKRQRKEADALGGALLQSVFREMFGDPLRNEKGWESIQFGEIISETKNGLYKNEKFLGKGTPILRMYNIYQNRIVLDKYHLITATDDEIREYLIKPGDILFNRVNSRIWLGKCAVIPKDIGEFLFESKNIRIRLDRSKADPEYIVWFLSTPAGREEIMKRAKDAVNQSTVNNTDLREFKILLPPLALQEQFAHFVQDMERIREREVASEKEIAGLCEGLMQRAFAGELVA